MVSAALLLMPVTAAALAQSGGVTLELHVSGVSDADPVADDQIVQWLSAMIARSDPAPSLEVVDWTQVLPDQPRAWSFVIDADLVGSDWVPRSGLELRSASEGAQIEQMSASRQFSARRRGRGLSRWEAGHGRDAPTVTYSVEVRRRSEVMSTQKTGGAWSLDSPDEVFALAALLDARSAQLTSP